MHELCSTGRSFASTCVADTTVQRPAHALLSLAAVSLHGTWLQVCLFADDRELPGFLTKEEAEEEKQANNSLSPADNRHMRFAESARQEHISESLRSEVFMPPSTTTRDPRAPDAPPGATLHLFINLFFHPQNFIIFSI